MNSKSFLTLSLLSVAPSLLFAQPQPPAEPAVPAAPSGVMRPARPSVAPLPASPAAPAQVGELLETPQAPPAPKPAPAAEAPPQPPSVEAPRSPAPAKAPAPPPSPAAPRRRGQMINVRIDVTLSDSKGAPKVLTMTVADMESGMNRTTAVVVPGASSIDYSFNADASPEVVGDRIRLRLTADAVVPVEAERATAIVPKLALRQSQTVILNDGETVEIARAADPASPRTFVLSVKATIQR